MKASDKIQKIKLPLLLGFGLIVLAGVYWGVTQPIKKEISDSYFSHTVQKEGGVAPALFAHVRYFFLKVHELELIDRENKELTKKLALAERELEELKEKDFHAQAKKEEGNSPESEKTIGYQVPKQLAPHQLYALGVHYFEKKEFEKSAVIFSFLNNLQEDLSYQRSEVYLMTTMSWFHVRNYEKSESALKSALEKSELGSSLERKIRLWSAILKTAQGQVKQRDQILNQMIAEFPHEEETSWINGQGIEKLTREKLAQDLKNSAESRTPASPPPGEKEDSDASIDHHEPKEAGHHETKHNEHH